MSFRWKKILVAFTGAALLVTACKKNVSTDTPLPTSYYPSIVISSDNNVVYAINPATGQKNWEYGLPTVLNPPGVTFTPSPLIYNDMVYMASVNTDTLYKINAKTGALVKKMLIYPHGFYTMQSTPIADGKLIYLTTSNDTIYAVDTGTGVVKWKFGSIWDNTPFVASPVIYNNYVYAASTGGHVFCIDKVNGPDATTGNPIWDYPGVDSVSKASFISSPCVMDTVLFVGSAIDSNMYCISLYPQPITGVNPTPGLLHWTFKTQGNIKSSPTAHGGLCFFGCNDFYVYCVDGQLGRQQWKFHTNSQVNSSPILSGNVLYIGSYDYNLYAINVVNGSQKWRFTSKGLIKSSPLPYNGYVYVGSYDGYLYAVDSAFGVQKWSYKINGNIECSPAIDDYSGKQYNSGISGFNTLSNIN